MSKKIEFEAEIDKIDVNGSGIDRVILDTTKGGWWRFPSSKGPYRVTLEPVEPELKPCPHCSCSDIFRDNEQVGIYAFYWFKCLGCGATGGRADTIQEARRKWNRRT